MTVTIRNPLVRAPRASAAVGVARPRVRTDGKPTAPAAGNTVKSTAAAQVKPGVKPGVKPPGKPAAARVASSAGRATTATRTAAASAASVVVRPTAVVARAVTIVRARRRPRYRYSLTSIDEMFFRVREPIAMQRTADRRARRRNVWAMFVLIGLIVGMGIGVAYGLVALLSGINEWLV